mmetsp:Transcript_4717/g.14749  ORF Transcript_4717/g.14749 Transcript_4717/m.14749 type:complete len:234 (-) Transcript_4717:359-1060(-)
MGNEASTYLGLSSSKGKEKGPELIDEYDTETKTWRRVPVVDEDEELVEVPKTKPAKTKLEVVKEFFASTTKALPRKKRWWLALVAVAVAVLAALAPRAALRTKVMVRVDSAKPLSAFLGAADAARVKRRLAEHVAGDDFRKILARVSQPLTLTFTVLENGESSEATLAYENRRGESGLLLARCSKPTSRACDLVFKPPPEAKRTTKKKTTDDDDKKKRDSPWWFFPSILRGGI